MRDPQATIEAFRAISARRTSAELHRLAHIKRFNEYLSGDPAFRDALLRNQTDVKAVTDAYGLDVEPRLMEPLFTKHLSHHRFENGDARWPDAQLWDSFIQDKLRYRDLLRDQGSTAERNARFDAWRNRQMRRCASELGSQAESIVHALVSFELSRGCSVGCWFCGISADRFSGHLPYTPETGALWRGVVSAMVDRFGSATQTGFCYWATDPCDNPDYPLFLEAYHGLTGMLPQTTTAAPMKNVALTRRILEMSERHACAVNRFSILTVPILRRVFAEFKPEELLHVELVMQQKDALAVKSISGRVLERVERDRREGRDEPISLLPSQSSTIACVSGFLVNMVDRKVRLVSPTRSSDRWPDGYRVYAEAHFEDHVDFASIIDEMMDRHMPDELDGGDVLRFRPDLHVSLIENGFTAQTEGYRQTYLHPDYGARLSHLLSSGDKTVDEIIGHLGGAHQLITIHHELQGMFDRGLFDDDPVHGGINR